MSTIDLNPIIVGVRDASIVPYLGPGVLADVTNKDTGQPIPAGSESLILALNGGKPMAPKLMYEFPRAAMNVELKRGRSHVNNFLVKSLWMPSRGPGRQCMTGLAVYKAALCHRYQSRHTIAGQLRRRSPHACSRGRADRRHGLSVRSFGI